MSVEISLLIGQQLFITFHLQLRSLTAKADPGAGPASEVGACVADRARPVGVATGMVDILRFTGVGRAEGRRAFTCCDRQLPAEGVRGPAEGF